MPMKDCPFCARIERKEYESYADPDAGYPSVIWFEPLNPVAPGHLLFMPVSHVVSNSIQAPYEAGHAAEYAVRWARDHGIESYNIITSHGKAATQSISHVHIHLVPRFDGDGLPLPWTSHVKN
jgi:histidine triad (HIT) family protein